MKAATGRIALLGGSLLGLAIGCRPDASVGVDTPPVDPVATFAIGVPHLLSTPTYDGSGQSVHPDYASAPSWWPVEGAYLAITPYPGGNVKKENPSLLEETSVTRWHPIDGGPDPIVYPERGHLSDPDIVFDSLSQQLWLYYRGVRDGRNWIRVVRTSDGKRWSDPVTVIDEPAQEIISPSVVQRAPGDWWMWSVNAGPDGCTAASTYVDVRHSTNGLDWGPPLRTLFPSPDRVSNGFLPWHIEVRWIPSRNEYWAVYNAKDELGCATQSLFLSTSRDGIRWTARPQPLLLAGEIPGLGVIVYRTTFEYDQASDVITFWFSGASQDRDKLVWHTVMQRRRRARVFMRTAGLDGTKQRELPKPVALTHPPEP